MHALIFLGHLTIKGFYAPKKTKALMPWPSPEAASTRKAQWHQGTHLTWGIHENSNYKSVWEAGTVLWHSGDPQAALWSGGCLHLEINTILTLPVSELGIYKTESFFQKEEAASTNLPSSHLHNFLFCSLGCIRGKTNIDNEVCSLEKF